MVGLYGDCLITEQIPVRKAIEPIQTLNESMNTLEEFFYSLGRQYGEMAHNEIEHTRVEISDRSLKNEDYDLWYLKRDENRMLEDASAYMLVYQGDYLDVIVNAHEITHRLSECVSSAGRTLREYGELFLKQVPSNFINDMGFSETTAMFVELLCNDFISRNYGDSDYIRWSTHNRNGDLISVSEEENDGIRIADINDWMQLIMNVDTNLEGAKTVKSFLSNHKNMYYSPKRINMINSICLYNYKYILGYMMAIYLKDKCGDDKEKIDDVLNTCIQINAYGNGIGFQEEQVELLEGLDIPIVKNGKIVIDEECIGALSTSYVNFFSKYKDIICGDSVQNQKVGIKDCVLNALNDVSSGDVKEASCEIERQINDGEKEV